MRKRLRSRPARAPSLADVAAAAGVSETTASVVLSGRARQRRVAARTVERVRAAAERLGYAGNAAARSLAVGSPRCIAIAVSDTSFACLGSAYTSLINAGAIARASALRYEATIVGPSPGAGDYLARALAALDGRRCDGIVVTGPLLRRGDAERLAQRPDAPVVVIDPPAGLARPAVRIDWRPGIAAAAADLAARGHREALYAGGDADRFALLEAGLAARRIRAERTPGGGAPDIAALAARVGAAHASGRPLALVAYNDALAIALCRALAAHGVVPGVHLSLLGFDGVESRHAVPRLASIDHRFGALGATAVELLVRMLGGGAPPPDADVEAEYLPGDSLIPATR